MLIVGIYMGISLVKFVIHIFFRIHDQHSHKLTAFQTKNYTKTASLSNGFLWPTLQYLQAFDCI